MFTFECERAKEFSSYNTLFKICEEYSRSARDYGYINIIGGERDSGQMDSF